MDYLVHILILFSIYGMLAISLNLVVGYSGLLSVTHAAFYGIGAYATTLLMINLDLNFFLSLLIGMVFSGGTALLIGLVLSKFKDDFYAIASLGFNVIVYSIMLNWQTLTRGPLGIPAIPRPSLFGFSFFGNFWFLILVLFFLIITYLIARSIVNSSFGRVLKAIRENELATQIFGYNTKYFKLTIFVIAAVMAGVAGSFFASYVSFIDPSTFTMHESIFILSIVILGGLANLRGAVLGAFILIILPEALRFLGLPNEIAAQSRQLIYGVILVLLMLYRPQGLIGEFKLK